MMKMVNNLGKLGNCFELFSAINVQVFNKKEFKELEETIFLGRSILSNFMKKSPTENGFAFLINEIESTLERLSTIFSCKKILEGRSDLKLQIYDLDYLLKQQLEQINFEFVECNGISPASLIEDIFAKKFWIESFGKERLVEKGKFIEELIKNIKIELTEQEIEELEYYLDFTDDGYITVFEFHKFLVNFGPFRKLADNVRDLHQNGIQVFKISSKRANTLLEKKHVGNYLLRFSKTQSNSFAITYIDNKKSVKNSLIINTKDGIKTTSSNTIYPTLPNFLRVHSSVLKVCENLNLSLIKSLTADILSQKVNDLALSLPNLSSPQKNQIDCLPSLSSNQEESKEVDNQQISSVCISCNKSQKDSVMDCKHFICCFSCSTNLKACPLCNAPNNNPIQIYVC